MSEHHTIDAAHARGLVVFLDVVYNHFGPDGNYLGKYASRFFDADRHTPWGAAIAFDEPAVRDFFIANPLYWLSEFRFDGLRFDAIDHFRDPSERHILVEKHGSACDGCRRGLEDAIMDLVCIGRDI